MIGKKKTYSSASGVLASLPASRQLTLGPGEAVEECHELRVVLVSRELGVVAANGLNQLQDRRVAE